jgi:AcrR family transcriptional regulator
MPKVIPEYKEEAKERIIQAALQVFTEKGYHEATMEDVAQKVGVSRGAIYLYFKNKDEILYAIMEQWDRRRMKNFLPPFGAEKELEKSLESMFDHIVEDPLALTGLILELFSEAARNQPIRKVLSEGYERSLKTISEFLAKQNLDMPQSTLNLRQSSIGFMMIQLGLMANLILDADKAEIKLAWNQLMRAITKT